MSPLVGVIMGSDSDIDIMNGAVEVLNEFNVAHEVRIISAHRTPDAMASYAAEAKGRGLQLIIAGAGGSAHLPGMTASHTVLPVIAVPIKRAETDHEALWSKNAALLAIEILALQDPALTASYEVFRAKQAASVVESDAKLQV
jgi:5-(carboxyamino)imidazole ribonucleotide mutase